MTDPNWSAMRRLALRHRYLAGLTGASGGEQPVGERGRVGYSLLRRYIAALVGVRLPPRDTPPPGGAPPQQVTEAPKTATVSPPDTTTRSSARNPDIDRGHQGAALLSTIESVLGTEHPDTLTARYNLARWTGEAGDAAAARDQFAALLRIRERVLGTEHPDTLTARYNLARWTGEAGDAAAARDQFAALLPTIESVLAVEHPTPAPHRTPELTPQERAIARLVASGMSNREIARELVLSVRTVDNHLQSAYKKLGVTSRAALAATLSAAVRSQPEA
ncbi:helix-turn-helix transcriptional regulator [Nonomuraea lactucae]|uniref:helix-turn-helix transcriptional regulator n=1 Tax=Nonomuraea lactucae TaxID=2249762 RepID=UPI001F05F971|nr:LuxR C-terminal-related transcriptional regulator [Nonomuraea lactucae]